MVVKKLTAREVEEEILSPAYTHRMDLGEMPKYRLPDHGAMPDVAERLNYDELMLDGNARLNLATFVTTWMEPQAENSDNSAISIAQKSCWMASTIGARGFAFHFWTKVARLKSEMRFERRWLTVV